jgi:hypothetical protein
MTTTTPEALLLPVALLAFYAYCLVDFTRTPEWQIRTFDKRVWVVLLVFTNVFGGVMWLCVGRPNAPRRR